MWALIVSRDLKSKPLSFNTPDAQVVFDLTLLLCVQCGAKRYRKPLEATERIRSLLTRRRPSSVHTLFFFALHQVDTGHAGADRPDAVVTLLCVRCMLSSCSSI